ncbi:MAG: diguanylate cyclase, partial [Rhodoferax sp.]|nr:diguanylate cyclase [Rhodoferax sp.]
MRRRNLRIFSVVTAIVATFLLAIGLATTALIWDERTSAIDNTSLQATRFATGAVAALNRSLVDVDVLLASLEETKGLNLQQAAPVNRALRALVRQNLMLHRLALVDAQGRTLASSDVMLPRSIGLPGGDATRALTSNLTTLAISAPRSTPDGTENVIFLTRRISTTDDRQVLAVAEVLQLQLNTILVQGANIGGLEVTLERHDGTLITSAPLQQDQLAGALNQPLEPALNGLIQTRPARLSGQPALVV